MGFRFRDSLIQDYRTRGCAIFRQILPPSLIRDLRRATAQVHHYAREKRGPQAQRLQPIVNYNIDIKPFWDYAELPPLVDAIGQVLTPEHRIANSGLARTGLLLEPRDKPWCTAWHRDIRETSNVPDLDEFRRLNRDPIWFNQINCPLYEDNCTWYVPGSHLRDDLPGEIDAAGTPLPPEDEPCEERERACLEYSGAMPSAERLFMDAGDFALYHPNGWHLGNYLPGRRRVTIHDFAPTPQLLDWYDRWERKRSRQKKEESKT